jgi:RND family efflux transporter MFP subunit
MAAMEGRIESIRVRVGDRVSRGSVIVTLNAQAVQRELAIAEAALVFARTEEEAATVAYSEAAERLKRREDPHQLLTGALSEEELATARYQERLASTKLSGARAQVAQKEAGVQQVRLKLQETSLVAPFDALVASRYVDSGALVSPGRPIVHLLRADGRKVRFAIPETQAQNVAPELPVRVVVAGYDVQLTGRIVSLSPEVDVASRMIFGIASIEEPKGKIIPAGVVVRVSVVNGGTAATRGAKADMSSPLAP